MLTTSTGANPNYVATVCKLQSISDHPNADRLSIATVLHHQVVVGKDDNTDDLYVFFPIESRLSTEFLSYTNSFRHPERNRNPEIKGFFEDHGRVRMVRLRQVYSNGYVVEYNTVKNFALDVLGIALDDPSPPYDFDSIGNHVICMKYVAKTVSVKVPKGIQGKKPRISRLIEGQWSFHPDTPQLKRCLHEISPLDIISITNKVHGSSSKAAKVLVKRSLTWKDRLCKALGAQIRDTEYDLLASSRRVIKNTYLRNPKSNDFYSVDIFMLVANEIGDKIPASFAVTGEIVGFLPTGAPIQKDYDYGCSWTDHDFYVFRVEYIGPTGLSHTLGHKEMVSFCECQGLKMVETFYYGRAVDLFPNLSVSESWPEDFLKKLEETYLDKKCHLCKNDVWAEGIVVRKEVPFEYRVFKLKSPAFLGDETARLDKGETSVEAEEESLVATQP